MLENEVSKSNEVDQKFALLEETNKEKIPEADTQIKLNEVNNPQIHNITVINHHQNHHHPKVQGYFMFNLYIFREEENSCCCIIFSIFLLLIVYSGIIFICFYYRWEGAKVKLLAACI